VAIYVGSAEERGRMAKQTFEPGPGRSTADAAFTEFKKEIAQRNERAQKEARKLRTAREAEQARRRRQQDLH
jgi:hypothetical protein